MITKIPKQEEGTPEIPKTKEGTPEIPKKTETKKRKGADDEDDWAYVQCIDGVMPCYGLSEECDCRHIALTKSDVSVVNCNRANADRGMPHKSLVVNDKQMKHIEDALTGVRFNIPGLNLCTVICANGDVSVYLPGKDPLLDVSPFGITLDQVSGVLYHRAIGSPPPLDAISAVILSSLGLPDVNYEEEAYKSRDAKDVERLCQNPRVFLDATEGPTLQSLPPLQSIKYAVWLFEGEGEARRGDKTKYIGEFTVTKQCEQPFCDDDLVTYR